MVSASAGGVRAAAAAAAASHQQFVKKKTQKRPTSNYKSFFFEALIICLPFTGNQTACNHGSDMNNAQKGLECSRHSRRSEMLDDNTALGAALKAKIYLQQQLLPGTEQGKILSVDRFMLH